MSRFDFLHPPFDVLTAGERDQVEKAVDIVFHPNEDVILAPGQSVDALYMVIKGIVREVSDDGEIIAVYHSNDTFDARALIAGQSVHRFEVHEEALVFSLPKELVMGLIESNPVFGAFFFQSVSEKFSAMAQRSGNRELQTLLTATVREACVKTPVFLDGAQTVLDAAQAMKRHRAKSILVRAGERIGIFTASDFRDIILTGTPASATLADTAHFNLVTTDAGDYLFNALLTMTRHNIQRVVVTENGQPIGVLEQIDLLSYFSNHSHLIAQQIELADSLDTLKSVAAQIDRLVGVLSSHGVKAPQLARLVQTLNAQLFARAWKLIAPEELVENSCLIVMGSEGRGEQIIKTDQDNALILRDGFSHPYLEDACARFSEALIEFGYPPCPGQIMVNNPLWRKPQGEFQDQLYRWVYLPDADAQMNLAIFVDAEAVAGDAALLHQAKDYLRSIMSDDVGFFLRFARAIEQFDTPLGLFSQLLTKSQGGVATLDLKKGGIFPIVHGIRAMALEYKLEASNTLERIKLLVDQGNLESQLGHDTAEALSFLLEMRLKAGLDMLANGKTPSNQIQPDRLSTLERDLLKDALAVVKRFKTTIRHHFKMTGF